MAYTPEQEAEDAQYMMSCAAKGRAGLYAIIAMLWQQLSDAKKRDAAAMVRAAMQEEGH